MGWCPPGTDLRSAVWPLCKVGMASLLPSLLLGWERSAGDQVIYVMMLFVILSVLGVMLLLDKHGITFDGDVYTSGGVAMGEGILFGLLAALPWSLLQVVTPAWQEIGEIIDLVLLAGLWVLFSGEGLRNRTNRLREEGVMDGWQSMEEARRLGRTLASPATSSPKRRL
jgi:hypothetical protein